MVDTGSFIKTKSGLVLNVVDKYRHRYWVTITAMDALGQLHYLDSRRDEFDEIFSEEPGVEFAIVLIENRLKEINAKIVRLEKEREYLLEKLSQRRERLAKFSENPIEDFKYD